MSALNRVQKEAVACLCATMIAADGKIDYRERELWSAIKLTLDIQESDIPTFSGEALLKAMIVVRDMPLEGKVLVCKLLVDLMEIDGDVNPTELKLVNTVYEACGLKEIAKNL